MLVTTFIFYGFVALFFLVFAFLIYPRPNSEIFFGVAFLLFSVLAFAGTALETLEPQYDAATDSYVVESQLHVDYSLMGINIMFAALSMLFFFTDIFQKFSDVTKGSKM